ncbi:uncharacterized protein LOC111644433 [Seriola lalandi dorsalis]|uniref:uncharacterized protein LOC111644433 n=1 Tax=Seriola lalandi dorsalis TaxID=1841481 RepID=UPI000C6F72DD|nr:uncharacterized protein LOC111644433 [Seriola lalandi dorsalis]
MSCSDLSPRLGGSTDGTTCYKHSDVLPPGDQDQDRHRPAHRSNSGSSLLALTCPSHRKLAATHHKRRITAQSTGLSSDRRLEHTHHLETKPTLKGVKFYKHKLRRLEGLNKHTNTRWSKEDNTTQSSEHTSDQAGEAGLCDHYHYLLTEVSAVVTNPSAPLRLHGRKAAAFGSDQADFDSLLPALEVWAQQLQLLEMSRHQETRTGTPLQLRLFTPCAHMSITPEAGGHPSQKKDHGAVDRPQL